ncbi:hypothetical protein [Enemella evansiae]|uniref:Uncharacterized protein n=1 Tax=Enemella evansiae TaxID=2016499 RepID=A0A255GIM7_9ACTN|nr:hypothetical protein [Enemella evansiae]OYO01268.1 hypothetical protein CGZ97_17725 [Enemella evansiae]OYO05020.1 hypothetical protein CGZ95_01565 [Enemella evansiae]OYO14386.1 hypothetical protein CGZ94_07170 [Enemella evansiae]TDO93405.1 hypothetical protein C8D81_1188 [Enemella evansiae]
MADQLNYNTAQLRAGGKGVSDAGADLEQKFQNLLNECSDMSVFGPGNDTVGPIAQMIYQAVLERVTETVQSSAGSYKDFGEKMNLAADIYDQGEQDNSQIANSTSSGGGTRAV